MRNKRLIIILFVMLFLISCSQKDMQIEANSTQIALSETTSPTLTIKPTSTPEPVPSAEPKAQTPKYIFIVIGDGFGRGAMSMGEIYERLESEDMDKGAVWENFTYQSYVKAMGESASGGTAIASGIETEPWYIGKDVNGQDLYTIMDRAKEAGMGTGVITNSSLVDATPATFLSHITNRYYFSAIARCFPESNVDYMAGGGLIYILSAGTNKSFGDIDCLGINHSLKGPANVVPTLIDMGYETYFGLDGAQAMRESIEKESFTPEKSISIFTGGIMPYEYYKYRSPNSDRYDNIPSLVEMTEAGIQSLIQSPNGFVMMIEGALIDKCAHKTSQKMTVYEVKTLNKVLEHLMEFYAEHPDETLIILTADHETGNYAYNDELLNQWKASTDFEWSDSGEEMAKFVNSEWGLNSYDANLQTQIYTAIAKPWDTDEENRTLLYTALTLDVCKKCGIKIRSGDHSGQLVPLFAIGKCSEEFEGSIHTKEIPITICEFMGWEALPEVIEN